MTADATAPDARTVRESGALAAGHLRAVLADYIAGGRYAPPRFDPDDIMALLADRDALAARVAELEGECSLTTCAFPGCVHPDHQRAATAVLAEQAAGDGEAEREVPTVPELTEELLRTLPVPIAAAVHQLKLKHEGQRRRAAAAERRQEELRAEVRRLEQERAATAGFVAIWHDTALVQHEVDEIRCQACLAYMAGPLPLPQPVTLADLAALAGRHECLPRVDADLAARDEPPAQPCCGRCSTPFDPADKSWTGHAQYHQTSYCRECIDNCHEAGADHRCVICVPPAPKVNEAVYTIGGKQVDRESYEAWAEEGRESSR